MVIIVRTNNTIDIKDIDDYSFKNLAKTIDSTKIEPLRVYNSVNSQFDYYFYGVDPDGLNKHKEFSKFATTLSSLQNYYGDVIITKQDSNLNPTGFKNNEELAEIILKLISAFDFLKVGFLEDDLINTKVDDTFLDDVSYVSFGRYPQTLISDKVLSSKLDQITELNNYGYVSYEGKEYFRIKAIGTNKVTIKKKEVLIEKGNNYYFEIEPIIWTVLYGSDDADDTLLLSDQVIDFYYFNKQKHNLTLDNNTIEENDFYFSDIRKFLNRYFYSKAFSKPEKERIISIIEGDQIDEKVSLVSNDIAEYIKSIDAIATDYAICMGAERLDADDHTSWWLKSKGKTGDQTSIITNLGSLSKKTSTLLSYGKKSGIRPVIHVKKKI